VSEEEDRVAKPEIEHLARYVIGYPMHVAITVRMENPTARSAIARDLTIFGGAGLEITFVDARTGEEHPLSPNDAASGFNAYLVPGESRRMLVDLADFGTRDLHAGIYHVKLVYEGVEADPFDVALAAPTPGQKAELDRLAPELYLAPSWGEWLVWPPSKKTGPLGHYDRTDPLRFNRLLKYLIHTRNVTLASVPALDGLYAPEALLLRADLAYSLGDKATLAELAKTLREQHPELRHRLEAIEAGNGPLTEGRETAESTPADFVHPADQLDVKFEDLRGESSTLWATDRGYR
jgi:hypothetical protein